METRRTGSYQGFWRLANPSPWELGFDFTFLSVPRRPSSRWCKRMYRGMLPRGLRLHLGPSLLGRDVVPGPSGKPERTSSLIPYPTPRGPGQTKSLRLKAKVYIPQHSHL